MACALLPAVADADVVGFRFGIAYGDMLGHRGLSHSLLFAALLGLATAWSMGWWEKRDWRDTGHLALLFFVVAASHGPMDMLTNGGLGIALFAPFDHHRLFWDWRPILVSPIGLEKFLSPWGLAVLRDELLYFGPPTALLLAVTVMRRRIARRA